MYRGFQMTLDEIDFRDPKSLYNLGYSHISKQKAIVKQVINSFTLADGSLDGSQMQANWFPQISADIFLSHSHHDEKLAITFAGWLYKTFGLTAFIDSCVWGYANDLLRKIDNEYCYNQFTKNYNYHQRNYSTSHVHMMLSVALSQMIDNTECLLFINTPNSITPESVIQQTESPWIYFEIAMSRLIHKKYPNSHRKVKMFSSLNENLQVKYDLPTEHLTSIDSSMLSYWEKAWHNKSTVRLQCYSQYRALDELYKLTK